MFLTGAAAGASLMLVQVTPAMAQGLTPEVQAAVDVILAGRSPVDTGIILDAPVSADNGAQVPVTVIVDSPMTQDDHVTTIHLVATLNPAPGLGTFHLTPRLGRAEIFTRVRLAEGQEFLAFAETSDGRVLRAAARTAVTIGGCAT